MVGNTFSRRCERAFRSKAFSAVTICATVFPFRNSLFTVLPCSSFASASAKLRLSGFMPIRVPVKVLPDVVVTETIFSASAATSVKYFLCATDTFYFSITVRNYAFWYLSLIYI